MKLSWEDIEALVLDIAVQIREDRYRPDVIVAIPRGGWIPAVLIANLLGVDRLLSLEVRKQNEGRKIYTQVPVSSGDRILIVEDVLETGRSLVVARSYLFSLSSTVKTASLLVSRSSEVAPDYWAREGEQAHFPWDITQLDRR